MADRTELAAVIGERTLHEGDLKKLETAVAAYLLEQNMEGQLDSLMRDVLKYRAAHGIVEATAVSAFPLTGDTRSEVLQVLKAEYPSAKSYHLNERINPDVIGGVRLEMADEELDLTVRSKLNTLKRLTAAREK
jgi:F0F1-type ATP synthase delta subunit